MAILVEKKFEKNLINLLSVISAVHKVLLAHTKAVYQRHQGLCLIPRSMKFK